jgi:DNA-binding CsgD family transcriptional regulator
MVLLSCRQGQVLELLLKGLQNKQIANRLNIGMGTVKVHTAALMRKFNVHSRAMLIVRTYEDGAAYKNPSMGAWVQLKAKGADLPWARSKKVEKLRLVS